MEPVVVKNINEAIRVGYSGKLLGNTQISFGSEADVNFAKFKAKFPGKTIYDMPAVGKDNIVNVDTISPEDLDKMETDALITKKSSALLVLKAADCIPLVLYVPGQQILILAHVGTSSAALDLPAKAVKRLGVSPEKIHCYVGPSISQKSYRFPDKDLSDKKLDSSWDAYITDESDGIHINLFGRVLDELKNVGLLAKNIDVEGIDTGADPNYFSHRRHKTTGEPDGRNCFVACLN